MKPPTYLFSGSYEYCTDCKSGKFVPEFTTPEAYAETNATMKTWREFHLPHFGYIQTTTAQKFLSTFLSAGYIDEDREGLEPIMTSFGETGENTSGLPVGRDAALQVQKKMRWEDRPPVRPLIPEKAREIDAPPRPKNGAELYRSCFLDHWTKFDVGVQKHRIAINCETQVEATTLSRIRFLENQGLYQVEADSGTLEQFFDSGQFSVISRLAEVDVIRVAAMVRFGDDKDLQIEFLASQIADLRKKVEGSKKS